MDKFNPAEWSSSRRSVLGAIAGGAVLGSVGSVSASSESSRTTQAIMKGTSQETTVYYNDSGKPGTTAFVIGGIHGDELAGWHAADEVKTWMPDSGKLVVIPHANVYGIKNDIRDTPYGDLNRQFPLGETPKTDLARAIWNVIANVDPDVYVDLHESRELYAKSSWSDGQTIGYSPIADPGDAAHTALDRLNSEVMHDDWKFLKRYLPSPVEKPMGALVQRMAYQRGTPAYIIETWRDLDLSKRVNWQVDSVRSLVDSRRKTYGSWPHTGHSGSHELKLTGKGPSSEYQVRVTGEITDRSDMESADRVFDNRAYGTLSTGSDIYRYSGSVETFALTDGSDSDLTITVDGKTRTIAELNSDTGGSGGSGSSGGEKGMSVVGTGKKTEYRFTVSGSITAGSNEESGDTVSGNTASGSVQWLSDNYSFTGDITSFDVISGDDNVKIYVEGSRYSPSDFDSGSGGSGDGSNGDGSGGSGGNDGTEHGMSVVGTGKKTEYRFAVSGSITPGSNVESGDTISNGTVSGSVQWLSDNYSFTGDITSFDVISGDENVKIYVDGSRYSPSDFGSSNGGSGGSGDGSNGSGGNDGTEHGMSVVGTGEKTEYRLTISGDITPGSNVESGDTISNGTVSGSVQWLSDNYSFTGSITSFDVISGDENIKIYVDGSRYGPSDFPSSGSGNSGGSGDSGNSGNSGSTDRKKMSVVGTGNETKYTFAVSGSITPGDNVESGDTISGTTASGRVKWLSDNYEFTGSITSFDVISGDENISIWVEGSKYSPSDF